MGTKANYFTNPAISRGDLLNFKRSSKAGSLTFRNGEFGDTDAMKFGRAFHSFMELGESPDFFEEYHIWDESARPEPTKDFRNAKNRDWKKEQFVEAGDKGVLSAGDYEKIDIMAKNIANTDFYENAFNEVGVVEFEREFYATIDGIDRKCLTDVAIEYDNKIIVIDWKTTSSNLDVNDIWGIKRELRKWDLPVQDAHYKKVIKANTDKEVIFCFMFVENHGAHECLPLVIGDESELYIEGETVLNRCIDNYKEFLSGDVKGIDKKLNRGLLVL